MRKRNLLAICVLLTSSPVFAQSSVTLSGIMDAGISYISNESGHSNTKFDDGIAFPNILRLTGREDLGGGTTAIFELMDQYSIGTGSILPGQSLFSRTAYVGLDDRSLGKLTLGNQYDFMTDSLTFGFNDAATFPGVGLYGFRNGPFNKLAIPGNPTGAFDWDRMAGERIQNSVKYLTPTFAGFSAGAMYSFGGVPGSIGANNACSFALNYSAGPAGFNAAYTNVKYPVAQSQLSIQNWGVGGHYTFGKLRTIALFTTVRNSANHAAIWEGQVGALYQIDAAWAVSANYMYMDGNAALSNNHANQGTATLSYTLSKRSTVYLTGVYQRANSGANALINGITTPNGSSSSPNQFIARVGFETEF
ncbi:porin [Paraburkholderia pallida]|uniref:Porin n=1 Tax=Paraburkholderia pallida TaxID=2547399 RepID=A0A4P7D6I4_9BURK|nr:porin [Paraburkholderia pallida]QBR03758.1 porin [Paraburkholderia pallida]